MKNVLKKIGKIIGIFFAALFSFLALCCVVTLCWGGVQASKGSVTEELPETPSDFVPTVRFVVFTDTHNQNDNVKNAITTAYELYDNDETYKGIDGIFCLGDFTSIGTEPDYDSYIEALNEVVREDTPMVTLLGNHEMKNSEADVLFKEKFGYDPNGVYEINGFTFIAFSGTPHITEWTFSVKDLKWAAQKLDEAEQTAGGKAIFVLQHPHNFGTVYGSAVWCSPQTNPIWAGHSAVVNFSGHSHFPMNDPRSINQTTYTSIGVGAMKTFELDKNYVVGQHPDGYDTAAQFLICEADNDGSVRILEYDLNSETFFNEYYIDDVNDTENYAYTYKNLKAHDSNPVFNEDTKISTSVNENGEWVISFDEAEDNYIVHDYKIKIKNSDGKTVLSETYVDDYFVIDDDDTADFRIASDVLSEGESYTAEIIAVNAYHMKSEKLVLEFTAEK